MSDTKSKLEDTMRTLQQTEMNLENAQHKITELTESLKKTQDELKEKTDENAKLQIQIGTYCNTKYTHTEKLNTHSSNIPTQAP